MGPSLWLSSSVDRSRRDLDSCCSPSCVALALALVLSLFDARGSSCSDDDDVPIRTSALHWTIELGSPQGENATTGQGPSRAACAASSPDCRRKQPGPTSREPWDPCDAGVACANAPGHQRASGLTVFCGPVCTHSRLCSSAAVCFSSAWAARPSSSAVAPCTSASFVCGTRADRHTGAELKR